MARKKKSILDFNNNANPFGPPKRIDSLLSRKSINPSSYPDYKNIALNLAISKFLSLPSDNVAAANGSLEAIFAIPRIVDSSRTCIIKPTYWGYAAALDAISKEYSSLILEEADDFRFDIKKIDLAAKKSSLIFLCNPNNPTGSYIAKKDLLPLIKRNKNCHFFVDEAHLIMRSDYKKETLAAEVVKLGNLSIIYSTSKLFNIGGLRTGILASNKEVIEKFKKFQIPYSSNIVNQVIFPEIMKDKAFVRQSIKALETATKKMLDDLQRIKWLKVFGSETHFILAKILTSKITAIKLAERLAKDGFGIRECKTSYRELEGEWVRFSVNTEMNNKKLLKKLLSYNIN